MVRTITIPGTDETVYKYGFEGGENVHVDTTYTPWATQRTNLFTDPRGTDTSQWRGAPSTPESVDGSAFGRDTVMRFSNSVNGAQRGGAWRGTAFGVSTLYTVRFKARGSESRNNWQVTFRNTITTSAIAIATGVTIDSSIREFEFTFTTPTSVTSGSGVYLVNASGFSTEWFEMSDVEIEAGDTTAESFMPLPFESTLTRMGFVGAENGSAQVLQTRAVLVPEYDQWVPFSDGWSGSVVASPKYSGEYSLAGGTSTTRSLGGLVIGHNYTLKAKAFNTSGAQTTLMVGTNSDNATMPANMWNQRTLDFVATSVSMTATLSALNSTYWDEIELVHHLPSQTVDVPQKPRGLAPEYRYFTADLLTGEILAEIPLRDVSYERALKAAGKFSGKIPITAETDSMSLYDSTMPGNTAIYAMRNGVCVWGGIIWARQYQFSTRDLQISASEFTSYFYHRKIWKTWNHQFGGTVAWTEADKWRVTFDNGSNVAVKPDSTVHLEFYEVDNWKYNGYYRVKSAPAPTLTGFSMVTGRSVSIPINMETSFGWTYIETQSVHGYETGDVVTLTLTSQGGVVFPGGPQETQVTVDSHLGPNSRVFRFATMAPTLAKTLVEGTAGITLPRGTYNDVTITVRQDTFDYIRTLLDSMFEDFVGTDFPNVYIEPGISYAFNVTGREAIGEWSFIETEQPHGVAVGQAVQIQDVGPSFDGEYEVTDTPSEYLLAYKKGGLVPFEEVAPINATVTQVQMDGGLALITTSAPHGMKVGQQAQVELNDPYAVFGGTYKIQDIPSPTSFRYQTGSALSISSTTLPNATATVIGDPLQRVSRASVAGNKVTLELANPVVFSVGDTVTVGGVNRTLQITEKALDAPNARASVMTANPHGLAVGSVVSISGLSDFADVVSKSSTTTSTTLTTKRPHNFRVGDQLNIQGLDGHRITAKALTSNVATLTTEFNHNIPVGAQITVDSLADVVGIQTRSIVNGTARLTTAQPHNYQINDLITVTGLTDEYAVVSKEVSKGVVILTTSRPHNVLVGDKIKVIGVGAPVDTAEVQVNDVTATRIIFSITNVNNPETINIPNARSGGTVTVSDSYYNGQFTVTETGASTVGYARGGEDQPVAGATGSGFTVSGPSPLNGVYTVSARTANTVSYARTGSNIASAGVPFAASEDQPQPLISLQNIHMGSNRTVTGATVNTFTFSQSLPTNTTHAAALTARKASIFNGSWTITEVPTPTRFVFSLPGYGSSVLEEADDKLAFASATNLYNGTFAITAVDLATNSITYSKTLPAYGSHPVLGRGAAKVSPVVIVSSFGPFPGNANIDVQYSSRGYTGVNIEPIAYRGFELKSVGDALDVYSDNINGFEYRIDCSYDADANKFSKTFVMIPIDKPNPPAPGQVAPLSRYGADKLIFEYPGGNITEVSIDESAENSVTRFFAVGESDLGPEAGPNIGIASSNELLRGEDGRKWPLLDATENISGVDDEQQLYAHAQRYLSEAAPPYTTLTVSLNGSIAPFVGEYQPGDWCALILNDPFAQMRLQSSLEPRSDVVVRKIDSYKVKVPDGVTFPETVSVSLVAEWEVDKRG